MTNQEFVEKYKGSYPDIHGRTPWRTWDELAVDMEKDLKEVVLNQIASQNNIPVKDLKMPNAHRMETD
jgi:hypothetical protein